LSDISFALPVELAKPSGSAQNERFACHWETAFSNNSNSNQQPLMHFQLLVSKLHEYSMASTYYARMTPATQALH
jgi:hypothetical protein